MNAGKARFVPGGSGRNAGFVHVLLLVLFLLGVTTYGVIATQSEILERTAHRQLATPAALDAGKKALLTYARNEQPASPPTFSHLAENVYPSYDFFAYSASVDAATDFNQYIVSRPGQLPCPDTIGDSSNPATVSLNNEPPIERVSDGKIDGFADPGETFCGSDTTAAAPAANDSRYGRLPWREYSNFLNYVRGVGYGDIKDGNQDRLWYAVSRNLTNVNRPLNSYKILREDDDWLEVVLTVHTPVGIDPVTVLQTVSNVAAVVISPGTSNPLGQRMREDELLNHEFTPGYAASTLATLYLESDTVSPSLDNLDGDDSFGHNVGPAPSHADLARYVSRDEILGAFKHDEAGKHLDSIAKSLLDFHSNYKYLPDPATFEADNSEYITRRFGRVSDGIHPNIYSPLQLGTSPPEEPNIRDLGLQGGRIDYFFAPASQENNSTLRVHGTELGQDDVAVFGELRADDAPLIYPNPYYPIPIVEDPGLSDTRFLPPYTEHLHLGGGTLGDAEIAVDPWVGVIPANTPLRTAFPIYTQQPITASYTPTVFLGERTRGSSFSIDRVNGDYLNIAPLSDGSFNAFFADLRPGYLGNLSNLGYSAFVPRGAWIVSSVDITIFGGPEQVAVVDGQVVASPSEAYRMQIPSDTVLRYGVSADAATRNPAVPGKSALVPASQGLLPTPLLPAQLPSGVSWFEDARSIEGDLDDNFGRVVPMNVGVDYQIEITDPFGAVGYFPAEVTMHALFSQDVTPGTPPLESNRLTELTAGPLVRGGDVQVTPYPVSRANDAHLPSTLQVDGIITMPQGTRFFYPQGATIAVGNTAFSHGTSNRILNPLNNAANPDPERFMVHLAPGAQLGDVSVPADSYLPDGTFTTVAITLDLLDLPHGGAMSFDQLLHYHEGDQSLLPLTHDQAGFRIEAMGMESATNPNIFPVEGNGFHLYPFYGAIAAKSRILGPEIDSVAFATNSIGLTVFDDFTLDNEDVYLDFPVSRSLVDVYNIGPGAESVVTLSLTQNRASLAEVTAPSYYYVDESGLGVEERALEPVSGSGFLIIDTAETQLPTVLLSIAALELDFDSGVQFQANPGRMILNHSNFGVDLHQFGALETNTPLVSPFSANLGSFGGEANGLTVSWRGDRVSPAVNTTTTLTLGLGLAELALHLSPQTTLRNFNVNAATATTAAPSDRLHLGDSAAEGRHMIVDMLSDSVLNNGGVKSVLPAGMQAEFGWLEWTINDNNYLLPGGRVFEDVGFYPLASGAIVRFDNDHSSIRGPDSLEVVFRTEQTITLELPHAAGTLTVVSNLNESTITITEPRLLIPAGFDFGAGVADTASLTAYVFDSDAMLIGDTVLSGDRLDGGTSTVSFADAAFTDMVLQVPQSPDLSVAMTSPFETQPSPLNYSTEALASLRFDFVSRSEGHIVASDSRSEKVGSGQVMRLSMAPSNTVVGRPELHPRLELSWSGRSGKMEFSDFEADSLVFAQNNPLFYAVAPGCREATALTEDCTEFSGGLNVHIPAGEQVVLPEPSVAPGGLVIHGYRGPRQLVQSFMLQHLDGSVAAPYPTVTVEIQGGLRINQDGTLDVFRARTGVLNLLEAPTALDAPLGSTVVVIPNEEGLAFRYEPDDSVTEITLADPISPSELATQERIEIVHGGFTLDRQASSAFKVTVAASVTMNVGTGSRIYAPNSEFAASVYLSEGSTYTDDGGTTHYLGDLHLISGQPNLELELDSNAVIPGRHLSLPAGLRSGTVVTLRTASSDDGATRGRSDIITLPNMDITIPGSGYAWQGIIQGIDLQAYAVNEAAAERNLLVRNYNFDENPLTFTPPSSRLGPDLAQPLNFPLVNASLTAYRGIPHTLPPSTVVLDTADRCWVCRSYVIDVSAQATLTVGAVFSYPDTVTVSFDPVVVTASASWDPGTAPGFSVESIDSLLGGSVSLAIATHDPVLSLTLTGATIGLTLGPAAVDTDYGSLFEHTVTPFDLTSFVGGAFETATAETDYYIENVTIAVNASVTIGTMPSKSGFTIDNFGEDILTISIGQPMQLTGPVALFKDPRLSQFSYLLDDPVFQNAVEDPDNPGTNLTVLLDSSQLFLESSETRIAIENEHQLAIHFPVPAVTIGTDVAYAGSILYPETGLMVLANRFNITDPLEIILGANGAVANISGAAAAGRPALFTEPRLGSLSSAALVATLAVSISDPGLGSGVFIGGEQEINVADFELYFPQSSLTVREIDTRAMDAVLQEPARSIPPGQEPSNLIPDSELWFAPALHRISLPAGATITINPSPTMPPSSVATIHLPDGSMLNALLPTSVDAVNTVEYDVGGMRVDNEIPAGIADIDIVEHAVQIAGIDATLTYGSVNIEASDGGRTDREYIDNPIYQNLWVRIADELAVEMPSTTTPGATATLILPPNTVINPLLGTYLPSDSFLRERIIERIVTNSPSEAVVFEEMEFARPSTVLPAGAVIDVGNNPINFADVKALLAHSPAPLHSPVECSLRDEALVIDVDQVQERRGQDAIPENVWEYTGAARLDPAVTIVDEDSPQVGDAHPCMLLDLPENTDGDNWFIYSNSTKQDVNTRETFVNDRMRMVGGRIVL